MKSSRLSQLGIGYMSVDFLLLGPQWKQIWPKFPSRATIFLKFTTFWEHVVSAIYGLYLNHVWPSFTLNSDA